MRAPLLPDPGPLGRRAIAESTASYGAALQQDWNEAQVAAQKLGLEMTRYDVGTADEFAAAFAAMTAAGTDSLLILQNRFFSQNRGRLLASWRRHRLPMMADSRTATDDGGLMSYGADRSTCIAARPPTSTRS